MKKAFISLIAGLLAISFVSFHANSIQAQETLQCGDIFEGEFTEQDQTLEHFIELSPRDKLRVSGSVVGDYLEFDMQILSPSGAVVGYHGSNGFGWNSVYSDKGSRTPFAETGVLGERGAYRIQIQNDKYLGIYTLYLGCTLGDGTNIEPGDTPSDVSVTGSQADSNVTMVDTPPFTGFGFPGLSPVDFSNGVTIPLAAESPNPGSISTGFDGIFGFSFEANAGDTMQLDFTRLSGNLNLGLVVLSADNKVAFQASLVTSESLSTRFRLPTAGQYTIGVFRIDLDSPETPENTSFQIQGVINP